MKVSLVIAMVTTVTLVANAQLLVYYVAGPLIANFTYVCFANENLCFANENLC